MTKSIQNVFNEWEFCALISELAYCNPFITKRVSLEKAILGDHFQDHGSVWHAHNPFASNPNIERIQDIAGHLIQTLRKQLDEIPSHSQMEIQNYIGLGFYYLYQKYESKLHNLVLGQSTRKINWYPEFEDTFNQILHHSKVTPYSLSAAELFSCFWQIRRAFHCIFTFIVGRSPAVAELRARVWQSIFTHDMRRYQKGLFLRMSDITTLIFGPSGTGKELVAKALGLSRYIPFDRQTQKFKEDFHHSFFALNLSALSPTLLEGELFGHKKGSFTGAISDRIGWLESCSSLGTVFLDEIGELDQAIQVKLLRVLQARTFQRLGETVSRRFDGKIITATNRNLTLEIVKGRFREDLYYRLCADQIETPSLAVQIKGNEMELLHLVEFIAKEVAGPELSRDLAVEVVEWIEKNLPIHYQWPGNFRELEQCVRNVMIGGKYTPSFIEEKSANFWEKAKNGEMSADTLLNGYCLEIFAKHGSYLAASRILNLDRRTVKSRVEAGKQQIYKPANSDR